MNTSNYHSLYTFTQMQIMAARRAAKSGRKEDARLTLKFVRNSRILEILKPVEFPHYLNVDVAHLQWQLTELETECHPMSEPDHSDDFTAIRAHLETLAGGLSIVLNEIRSNRKA